MKEKGIARSWIRAGALALLVLLGGRGVASAQGEAAREGAWILSDPMGAFVELSGTTRMRGLTPWRLDERVQGRFHLRAELPGYETWEGGVVLDGSRDQSYTIRLRPKTRRKAFLRSVLVPGWGQGYAGAGGRARLFFLAELAAAAGAAWAHLRYEDRLDDYRAARSAYLSEVYEENIPARREAMEAARRDAEDAYDLRGQFLWGCAAVWAANVLDILFWTHVGPPGASLEVSPGFQGDARPGGNPGYRLALSLRF
jgi:hypothetical protein